MRTRIGTIEHFLAPERCPFPKAEIEIDNRTLAPSVYGESITVSSTVTASIRSALRKPRCHWSSSASVTWWLP